MAKDTDGHAADLTPVDRRAEPGVAPYETWGREELWSALFEQAPMPYALYELATRKVLVNRTCAQMFGHEHTPLAWYPSWSFGHPDDMPRTDALLAEVGEGETGPIEYDRRYARADGTVFDAHVHASVLKDHAGGPWGVLLAFEDVTEQRATERRLQALLSHAGDAIVILDGEGRVTWASPSCEQLIGEPVEPFIGQEIFRWAFPDDRPAGVEIFLETLANPGGVTGPLRIRLQRNDGSVRTMETVATNLLEDAAVKGIVLHVRDVTDEAEVTSALEKTKSRYRLMLENISDTVTLLDREGRIILTTGNLRPVMDYPLDFWEGMDGFALLHPDDIEYAKDAYVRMLDRPGGVYTGELRVRQPDGTYRELELTSVNLLDEPEVQAIVVTSRDVTERNQVMREEAESRQLALRSLRERTEFIANVSHELRTPIHGILGLAELLATNDLDDDARELTRLISSAADSMRMVLDDILDFLKIEVGRLETNSRPVSIRELVTDIDALFQSQARAKGIRLTTEIEPSFPSSVRADPLRLRQVLTNLIGNAVKFTDEGTVKVSVRREGDRPEAPQARVSIRDTGIGIPAEVHGRLFEPYTQAYGDTGRTYGGTGLGLAIAKRLVQLMGGEMGFTSEVGVGSEFWLTIPMTEVTPAPSANEDHPPQVAGDERRVLVVEDNPINQLLVRSQLTRLGYEPVVVGSGDAALETIPGIDVDLVLMDRQLPGIDGLETTRRLRAWEAANDRRRTPVVAMTASALPGDRDQCLAAGMDDFIAKPVSLGTLGATVRRWLADPGGLTGAAGREPAAAPAEQVPPVMDPRALEVLSEELDDPSLVATVVRTFLRELPGRVDWIAAACDAGDGERLKAGTHTLRSTSAAVGARALVMECERLERLVQQGAPPSAEWDATALRAAAAAVADALGDQVGSSGDGIES